MFNVDTFADEHVAALVISLAWLFALGTVAFVAARGWDRLIQIAVALKQPWASRFGVRSGGLRALLWLIVAVVSFQPAIAAGAMAWGWGAAALLLTVLLFARRNFFKSSGK